MTEEWTAVTDYGHSGDWRPVGVAGSRDVADSEVAAWTKDVGHEHVTLAYRVVPRWTVVWEPDHPAVQP